MSDTLAEKKIAALPTLNKDNFPVWIWALESALRSRRVWKEIFAVNLSTKLPPKCPTDPDDPAYDVYMEKVIKACGWIDDAVGYEHLVETCGEQETLKALKRTGIELVVAVRD